jgi:hypothetical protein
MAEMNNLSDLVMESQRKERKRKSKQMETRNGDRDKKNRYVMEGFREDYLEK